MADQESERRVSKALLAEAARGVDRELESRGALNAGLQQLIAFAGVLLAAAFALGARAGQADVACAAQTLLAIFFVGAIGGLLIALLIALSALRPQKRTLPNPDVFRFYASANTKDAEMRAGEVWNDRKSGPATGKTPSPTKPPVKITGLREGKNDSNNS